MSERHSSDETPTGTDHETQPDGGRLVDSDVFAQMSDESVAPVSGAQRLERLIDLYIYAPFRVAWSDWRTRIGGGLIVFFILMGTVGPVVTTTPRVNEGPRYLSPFESMAFPLGTDGLGQGILRSIIHATPAMLQIATAGVMFTAGVAVVVGVTAGYIGGTIDRVIMTFTDIVLTLPGLPLIIIIAAIMPPRDPFMVGVIVAIDAWPGLARTLRSQVMTIREESYVEASRAIGMPRSAIINKEVMPQLAPYILLNACAAAAGIIGATVGLYFLGILPFTTMNWGVMMHFAHQIGGALAAPGRAGHWLFFPALALSSLMFGLIMFAQGMDRVFNPRIRARHAKTLSDEEGDDGESEAMTTVVNTQR